MDKLCVVLFLAVITSQAMGMSVRPKRQAPQQGDVLDDRYGWDRPSRPWGFPGFPSFPNFPFPDPNGQIPDSGQQQQQQQQTTTPATNNGGTTTTSPAYRQCIRDCLVTTEYNPVCGTDNVTYPNAGRLGCAKGCGLNVSLFREAPCPPATSS